MNNPFKRPVLTIFFQLDPLNPTIGGIQTCIKYVVKYAPLAFRIQLVGITHQSEGARSAAVRDWQTVQMYGREFSFLPLLHIADDNVRSFVPTTVKYAWALRRYLKRSGIKSDFYQFHRIEPTLFTKQLNGTKILYIHNDIYQEVKGGQKGGILWKRVPWLYFALERRLVSQFNHILSCNSDSVKLYQQQYPEIAQRVSYLRNTYDSELFYVPENKALVRHQLIARLNLPDNTRFILFAGRLHPQKQPLLLTEAMLHLKETLEAQSSAVRPHLIVVGSGELEDALKQTIDRFGLRSHVTLLGPVPQSELADLYRSCDLFTLTSAYEGLARGSLEALACGAPVVTTRAGETPKFLSPDSGIVCNDMRAATIAHGWQTVLTHPERYPASACQRVAAPYEAKQVVEALYGELLTRWQHDQDCMDSLEFAAESATEELPEKVAHAEGSESPPIARPDTVSTL